MAARGAGQHFSLLVFSRFHQVAQDVEQLFALGIGLGAGFACVVAALAAGSFTIWAKMTATRRSQRAARPPQVQRAGVAVADDLSRALAALMSSSGATSMSFLGERIGDMGDKTGDGWLTGQYNM